VGFIAVGLNKSSVASVAQIGPSPHGSAYCAIERDRSGITQSQ